MEALALRLEAGGPTMSTFGEAIEQGRLTQAQAYRVLAYADARRAAVLSPQWPKAHGRVAEAARELGLACLRARDAHGQDLMKTIARCAYEEAAKLEPAADWLGRSMALEKELGIEVGMAGKEDIAASEELRDLLGYIKASTGITDAELAVAGFRPSPEDVRRLATGTLDQLNKAMLSPELKHKLSRMKQGGTDEPTTEDAARKVPTGRRGDWWSMSWSTVGLAADGERRWALSICDATPPPHPHSNKILFSKIFKQHDPPSAEECEKAVVSAIVYPGPAAGPARRPEDVVLAWRMRPIFPAMQRLAARLGFRVVLEDKAVAIEIARAHGTHIEGRNH